MANEHRDITFAIADEAEFENDLKEFGLDDSGEEISVGCFDDLNRRYKMEPDEEFSEDSLRDFVEQFKEGKPVLLVFFCSCCCCCIPAAVCYLVKTTCTSSLSLQSVKSARSFCKVGWEAVREVCGQKREVPNPLKLVTKKIKYKEIQGAFAHLVW